MRNVQVFIMGAGKGSRIKYNLGKKMPKCLLPSILVSPNKELWMSVGDTILSRIVRSFKVAEFIGKHQIKIDLMISHKSVEISDYINEHFPDIELHQIDWSPSSVSTFKECIKIVKSREIYDRYIFINGDTFIDNTDSLAYTLNELIENDNPNSVITEKFKDPEVVWSSIKVDSSNAITGVYPDYASTTSTLCDITQFNHKFLMHIYHKICNNFEHEWWEMSFIEGINDGSYRISSVPIRKISYDRVLYNTNNLSDITEDSVNKILNAFGLNFKEEETFDVKEN